MELKKFIIYFLTALNLIALSYLIYFHFQIISYPYNTDQRDSITLETTRLLLAGQNPYSYESQPVGTNVYGILESIITLPFARIYGPTLIVHKAVTGFFILLVVLLFTLILIRKKVKNIMTLSLTTIFYSSLLFSPIPNTRPDSIGLFFFLLGLYIPYVYNFSGKSLLMSYIIGILAILAKPYFIALYIIELAYLYRFKSLRFSIEQTIILLFLGIGVFISINKLFPVYWSNTFFSALNSIDYVGWYFRQMLMRFIITYFGIFLSFAILLYQKKDKRSEVRDFFVFSLLICSLIMILKLGGNAGADYSYYFELISPFLLFFIGKLVSEASSKKILISQILITLNIFTLIYFFHKPLEKNDYTPDWENARKLIDSHTNILANHAFTTLMWEENKKVYDAGNSEFFKYAWDRKGIYGWFFKPDLKVKKIAEDYQNKIDGMVANKDFDLIITDSPFTDETKVSKDYRYMGNLVLHSYYNGTKTVWIYKIWVPFESNPKAK